MLISQIPTLLASFLLLVAASFLLIICLLFLIECVAAIFPNQTSENRFAKQTNSQSKSQQNWQDIRVAVLVPAHNEEAGIGETLTTLIPNLKPQDKLIVIADNCTDTTAEIAIAHGSTTIERHDPEHRGKGYALDFGLKYLQAEPPDVVVIIDADCTVHERAIEQLSEYAIASRSPVQGTYLMSKPLDSHSSKDLVKQFSNLVRNLVRPRGLANLGQSCLLNGTGMAFPWEVLTKVNLASGHIVEDLKLGLDLTIAGYQPKFSQAAKITAAFPSQLQAATAQKTRWEHGHLQVIQEYVPLLLKQAIYQNRFDLLVSAGDLCIPPLALLVLMWIVICFGSGALTVMTGFWLPLIIAAIAGLCFLTAILTAWAKFASTELPLQEFLTIPFYILWKIPLYLKFLIKPQNIWIRTQRH